MWVILGICQRWLRAIAQTQDRQAYAALFNHFAPRVKAYLIRLGLPAQRADELTQETMLLVWRKAAWFDPETTGAAAWIFTIARNLRIDQARRERLAERETDPMADSPPPPPADALLDAAQRAERLRAALIDGHSRYIQLLPSETRDPRIVGDMALAPAAVLVAITYRANPGLILTQRSEKVRKHAGQVAFPGGRVDPDDVDEIAGALREAREEIALPSDRVDIIGTSDRYHTFTGFDIVPVLGVIPPDLPLRAVCVPHQRQ